ncbi:glycerophosphoryl diester phosphodiesterase [Blastococcus colisei]|uniref:glycerophosphodiester phosphodiesterase n=1 Tax=Blastococcus colisei TaxID=1564162 RepID=A0A543PJU5_9ACTN|nr:glycerophosphodiester phosphodiesterase family protein [Blastococcus colisei]TQN44350.1 glycerophosphoryl diester phosphodiesterase [Blastococcus colisei]
MSQVRPSRLLLAVVVVTPVLVIGTLSSAPPSEGAPGPHVSTPAAAPEEPAAAPPLLVIGHRGASGYRPENTLAAYELAVHMGADYIETDLVPTADGALVARHENELTGTTDVAEHPEFAARRTTKSINGVAVTGWFTEDFTLAELRTLRAVERLPDLREENALYDGLFLVPTFGEVLELRETLSRTTGREIGVYVELKHPSYFDGIGRSLQEPLLAALGSAGLDAPGSPVVVASFETTALRELHAEAADVPLMQLVAGGGAPYDLVMAGDPRTYADLATPEGLAVLAEYADVVGPDKGWVIADPGDGRPAVPTSFVADAHAAGLLVHVWTFRNENASLPADLREGVRPEDFGQAITEQLRFWEAGVDGLIVDHADTGDLARDLFLARAEDAVA